MERTASLAHEYSDNGKNDDRKKDWFCFNCKYDTRPVAVDSSAESAGCHFDLFFSHFMHSDATSNGFG